MHVFLETVCATESVEIVAGGKFLDEWLAGRVCGDELGVDCCVGVAGASGRSASATHVSSEVIRGKMLVFKTPIHIRLRVSIHIEPKAPVPTHRIELSSRQVNEQRFAFLVRLELHDG